MRSWMLLLVFIVVHGLSPVLSANEILLQGSNHPDAARVFGDQKQLVVRAPIGDGQEAIITYTEILDTTPEQAALILKDKSVEESDIVLASDQENVIETFVRDSNKPESRRFLRILPLGKLAAARETLAAGFSNYVSNAQATLRGDRIGLGVLAITVGVDCMIWINASSFDVFQKSNMVMLNLAMAATFGLDRDLWGRLNQPVKNRMIKLLDRFMPSNKLEIVKSLSSRYLSNMLLGTGIQLVRTGLLSAETIHEAVQTTDFWLTAAKISALVTLTSFGWSELYASVDGEQQPKAKLILRRLSDIRGLIMCNLATVSMILQPHVYGSVPIVSYVVHGVAGLSALLLANRVVQWLESRPLPTRIYRIMQTIESYINRGITVFKPGTTLQNVTTEEIREVSEREGTLRDVTDLRHAVDRTQSARIEPSTNNDSDTGAARHQVRTPIQSTQHIREPQPQAVRVCRQLILSI